MEIYDCFKFQNTLSDFLKQHFKNGSKPLKSTYAVEKFRIEPNHILENSYVPDYIIKDKLKANADLIAISKPIMKELDSLISIISKNYILIIHDSNGVALNVINKSTQPFEIGNQCCELYDSSYAVACAIRQNVITEVFGYEQLYPNSPNCHSTNVAVCNAEGFVYGILTLVNINGPLSFANQIIVFGASAIEQELLKINKNKNNASSNFNVQNAYNSNAKEAFKELIGDSEIMQNLIKYGCRAANSPCTVLIEGESGTGKEIMARAIHKASRPNGPFVAINCGAIPMELLQSELFGYESGAFTGAKKEGMIGKFEQAHNGTLFLDEIGEMPLSMQVSLLRILQDKTVIRIGGTKGKIVDIRVIAATNRNLMKEVSMGTFREDLYYRLNIFLIKMPALRDHIEDVPLIAEHMLSILKTNYNRPYLKLNSAALAILQDYHWPGNVRELRNILERAVINCDDDIITPYHLPEHIKVKRTDSITKFPRSLKEMEHLMIKDTLERNQLNITQSAKELGITRATLYKKMNEHGISNAK